MVVCHFTIIRDPPPPKTHGPGMDGIFLCFCMCVSKSFGRMHEGYLYLHVRDSTRKSSSRSILTLENKIVIFIIQPHYTTVFIIFLFVSLFVGENFWTNPKMQDGIPISFGAFIGGGNHRLQQKKHHFYHPSNYSANYSFRDDKTKLMRIPPFKL